jgi:hypothetical protein
MQLYRSFPERHPLAHVDAMPTRAQTIGLFAAALRVALVAILYYCCAADWGTRLPISQLIRDHRDQMLGIAAGWVAFEFLVFILRARRAAIPQP